MKVRTGFIFCTLFMRVYIKLTDACLSDKRQHNYGLYRGFRDMGYYMYPFYFQGYGILSFLILYLLNSCM